MDGDAGVHDAGENFTDCSFGVTLASYSVPRILIAVPQSDLTVLTDRNLKKAEHSLVVEARLMDRKEEKLFVEGVQLNI